MVAVFDQFNVALDADRFRQHNQSHVVYLKIGIDGRIVGSENQVMVGLQPLLPNKPRGTSSSMFYL